MTYSISIRKQSHSTYRSSTEKKSLILHITENIRNILFTLLTLHPQPTSKNTTNNDADENCVRRNAINVQIMNMINGWEIQQKKIRRPKKRNIQLWHAKLVTHILESHFHFPSEALCLFLLPLSLCISLMYS